MADKAVIPTLGLGAVGLATVGPAGALAVLKGDFGTGIRMSAPLAMLGSLALCAHRGILVKDGRALELMNEVNTVLLDETVMLTRERHEVREIVQGLRRRGSSTSRSSRATTRPRRASSPNGWAWTDISPGS